MLSQMICFLLYLGHPEDTSAVTWNTLVTLEKQFQRPLSMERRDGKVRFLLIVLCAYLIKFCAYFSMINFILLSQ